VITKLLLRIKKMNTNKILLLLLLGLAACSKPEEEAKKLGFESVSQMKELVDRGYKDFSSYKGDKGITPEYFYKECKTKSSNDYKNLCQGKKVVWKGLLVRIDKSDGARVEVSYQDGSKKQAEKFSIDSETLALKVGQGDIGKIVEFEGFVGNANFTTPDIDAVLYAKLENDSDRAKRVEEQQRIAAMPKNVLDVPFEDLKAGDLYAPIYAKQWGTKANAIIDKFIDEGKDNKGGLFLAKDGIGGFGSILFHSYRPSVKQDGRLSVLNGRVAGAGASPKKFRQAFADFCGAKEESIEITARPLDNFVAGIVEGDYASCVFETTDNFSYATISVKYKY